MSASASEQNGYKIGSTSAIRLSKVNNYEDYEPTLIENSAKVRLYPRCDPTQLFQLLLFERYEHKATLSLSMSLFQLNNEASISTTAVHCISLLYLYTLSLLTQVMYSMYCGERIIRLAESLSPPEIVEALQQEDIQVSLRGVYYLIARYSRTQSIHDAPRSGRPSVISSSALQAINSSMQEDDETTTRDLVQKLQSLGLGGSMSSVARARQKLGWTSKATRYCQMIRQPNKVKRVEFCQQLLESGDTYDDVIFTDEAMVQLTSHVRRSYHQVGMPRKYKPKPKHPVKVYVWGGISRKGATSVVIFTQTMDADLYVNILQVGLLPFIQTVYPEHHRFQQDNDPKHTSRKAKELFENEGINWWRTPAESPDLNPIERVWSHMKYYLAYTIKPSNKRELVEGIKSFGEPSLRQSSVPAILTTSIKLFQKLLKKIGRLLSMTKYEH